MRAYVDGQILIAREFPVLWWMASALFLGVGSLFVAGPLGLMTDIDRVSPPLRFVIAIFGLLACGTGIYIAHEGPPTILQLDRARSTAQIRRGWLALFAPRTVPLDDLRFLRVEERDDDEGARIYRLSYPTHADPGWRPLSTWSHDPKQIRAVATTIREFAGTDSAIIWD